MPCRFDTGSSEKLTITSSTDGRSWWPPFLSQARLPAECRAQGQLCVGGSVYETQSFIPPQMCSWAVCWSGWIYFFNWQINAQVSQNIFSKTCVLEGTLISGCLCFTISYFHRLPLSPAKSPQFIWFTSRLLTFCGIINQAPSFVFLRCRAKYVL